MGRVYLVLSLMSSLFAAAPPELAEAHKRYQRTDYQGALQTLVTVQPKTAPVYALIGKSLFRIGEFKKSSDAFERAVAGDPNNSEYVHWLGRAYGRRAESGNPFTAPGHASKARQCFERAVELNPHNFEAMNDLFDYYLQAPGFLGGGFQKAEALAKRIGEMDPAEGHYAEAQLADKRKQFDAAEAQLRRAMELAPRQVGRVVDLANYLAKLGRVQESEAAFDKALKMEPDSPRILFERARTYVDEKRNLHEARSLLQRYLNSDITPDDPPKEKARELLKQASSGA